MQLSLESRGKLRESNSPIYNSKSNHTAEEIRTEIPVSFCADRGKHAIILD